MIIVVDANIIISGIINPYGPIPKILLQKTKIDFIVPGYALEEIELHKQRICQETNNPVFVFEQLLDKLLAQCLVFSAESISLAHTEKARKLTLSIDAKDTLYIAFCLALDALLWTGDLKLYKGLRKKGFNSIVTTSELKEIIKGII
jgi:predicted nucleic acid-binding protein